MSTTLLDLDKKLHQATGDWIEVLVTTAIAASNSVISTNLKEYDGEADDYFNNWWCYIVDKANATVHRQISDYATATGTLTVRGAALTSDGVNLATIRVYRYNRNHGIRAINDAIRETEPVLYKPLEDKSLITGNILPPFNWSTTSALRIYTSPTGTLAKNTNGAYYWRGPTSAKVTASGADDCLSINSNNYPGLLDLMGHSITFKCWVYPEVANDAFLTIYTLKADGTAQTLNSTTACPALKKTLLKLEDQNINDDIQYIVFRLIVHTDTKYVYFDQPRVTGQDLHEYLLPEDFQTGHLLRVFLQTSGYAEDACDDLHPRDWERLFSYNLYDVLIGTTFYKYLRLNYLFSSKRQLRLIGTGMLEELSADTDTITLDEPEVRLLIAYAKYKLFQVEQVPISSEDIARYGSASAMAYAEYQRLLPSLAMSHPSATLRLPAI